MEEMQASMEEWGRTILDYSPKLVAGVIVLVVGMKVAGKVVKFIRSKMEKGPLGPEMVPFIMSIINALLKMVVILIAAGIIGVKIASFMTLLAAMTFAIGMSLQGSLANVASGILILIFKPYKNGDFISIGDHNGMVREIQIINTIITSFDNEDIIIPNASAISDVIVNSTGNDGYVRIDFDVHMPYDESFDKVKKIILNQLSAVDEVLQDPAPMVGIKAFESHTIVVTVRPYATIRNYETAFFKCTEAVKHGLGKNNIKMSYSEGIELGDIGE